MLAIDSPPRAAQRGLDDIPGPAGGWLLGNATAFRRDLLGHLTRGMHEYGDVVGYELGPRHTPFRINIVAAHAPADVQQVLAQTERTFTKDTLAFRAMAEMMGSGLLTTEGDGWRRQRRMVQPLFTPKRVAGYANLMAEESSRAADEAPADGAEVDLHLLMMRYALRVVGRALFGNDIDDMVPVLGPLVPEVSSVTRRRIFSPLSLPLRYPTGPATATLAPCGARSTPSSTRSWAGHRAPTSRGTTRSATTSSRGSARPATPKPESRSARTRSATRR